jgi:DNA-binding SARP family transcriptional activator
MEFRILGPLEVVGDGRAVPLGGSKQRALLALLALHANETLSADRLIDELWGARPPASAANALQVHVFRLRKALVADVIRTRPHGYELQIDPGALDANRFEQLVAAGAFDEALALWRGPALADLAHEPFARPHIDRLEDLRLGALERRTEALLAGGRHDEVIGELERLIAEQPYRERLRGQLMVALYRAGRQADALDAFHAARATLLDDLGIEPGEHLRALQRAILEQAPELSAPVPEPHALPRALLLAAEAPFVAREHELRRLRDHWARVTRGACACVFVAGEAGIGKSSLAARFAGSLEGATVLYGRCDEELTAPYQPFVEALGELPQTDRRAVFAAARDKLARPGPPVLLVLDDLHWADPPTLLLLRHLVSRARPRALILALHRDDTLLQLWADLRRDGADRLAVHGLDEAAIAELLESPDPALAARLEEETGGNPFFVRELLAHMGETGELEVPDVLRDIVHARVQRLSDQAQALLATAAVAGGEFSLTVLEGVDPGHDLLDALDEATAAGLIAERGHGDYAFTHALVRHTLYDNLTSARRARLHRRVGETLESSGHASVQTLAHHYAAGDGDADKAAHYAIAAGRDAVARAGPEQAAALYRRGLDVLERAGQAGSGTHRELRRLLRQTRYEPLPELGAIPGWLWGRMSRAGQVAVALAVVAVIGIAAVAVPALMRAHDDRTQAAEQRRAREQAATHASIVAEQRPQFARGAPAGADPAARTRLLRDAGASVRTDAARRARVLRVECEPYPSGGEGAYECLAVTGDVPATERNAPGSAGQPYRLRIDYASGRYAYCRISPRAVKKLRAEAPLSPSCGGSVAPEKVQGQPG